MTVTANRLAVAGANLYYEVRGQGPLLLLIPGGPQDAGVFTGLAKVLATRYTVVALDPRGNSRSVIDGESSDLDLDEHADDAAALIATLTDRPVDVFGTSGGGQVALNLAARHPQVVRRVVVHEPATVMALADPSPVLASDRAIHDTYLQQGAEAAMQAFFEQNGLGDMDGESAFEPSLEEIETFERISSNFEHWLAHGMMPLSVYEPDFEALRNDTPRVLVGVGDGSRGQVIYEIGVAVAAKLGTEPVIFPGDHAGFEAHPSEFADVLVQVLAGN